MSQVRTGDLTLVTGFVPMFTVLEAGRHASGF